VAETTSGCLISAEATAAAGPGPAGSKGEAAGGLQAPGADQEPLIVPEDVGRVAAQVEMAQG
jgi:hypothetical protein